VGEPTKSIKEEDQEGEEEGEVGRVSSWIEGWRTNREEWVRGRRSRVGEGVGEEGAGLCSQKWILPRVEEEEASFVVAIMN